MADLHAKLSMRRKVGLVSLCMEFLLNGVWGQSHVKSTVVLESLCSFGFFFIIISVRNFHLVVSMDQAYKIMP
jgi:hypothetical protein